MKARLVMPVLLLVAASGAARQIETDAIRAFPWHGRAYQVAFQSTGDKNSPWPVDLVLRWRSPHGSKWHTVSCVEGVRLEKSIRLQDGRGRSIDALVVSKPGGSAQFISVVEVAKDPPRLRALLRDERDKGGFCCRFDRSGRLIGLKFTYSAWHEQPSDGLACGHVYTARNIAWLPRERRFRRGPVYVDDAAEAKASLTDVLLATGADCLLGTQSAHHEKTDTTTVVYSPRGLLWSKTPPELRSASRIRAVIRYTRVGEHDYRLDLVELRAAD